MNSFLVAGAFLAVFLVLLGFRVGRAAPADRLRAAGAVVAFAFLITHTFQVYAAVRVAEARENLAILGARATPRDEGFGILMTAQPSFAGLLLLGVVVLAAGLGTVGRGRDSRLPRVLGGLALLAAATMALVTLPMPGPAPDRAVGASELPAELHPLFQIVAGERRLGAALPFLVLAAAAAVLRARREWLAAPATPEAREDPRRVLAGAGLLLFTSSALLVEALVLAPAESAVRWGPAARMGWDLWLPWVLAAILPALLGAWGMAVSLRHGYHGVRRRAKA